MLHYFSPQPDGDEIPGHFHDPFAGHPHPLAIRASHELRQRIQHDPVLWPKLNTGKGGHMFGVLVVSDAQDQPAYLAGYSGQLLQHWVMHGFVPPIFDVESGGTLLAKGAKHRLALSAEIERTRRNPAYQEDCRQLEMLSQQQNRELESLRASNRKRQCARQRQRTQIQNLQQDQAYRRLMAGLARQSQQDREALRDLRRHWQQEIAVVQQRISRFEQQLSALQAESERYHQQQQAEWFGLYRITNIKGQLVPMATLFANNAPPPGAGDCATSKLLQYALLHALHPLALAEFWLGAPPAGQVRHSGHFYPPSRRKCQPLLRHQLGGLSMAASAGNCTPIATPEVVYCDEHLVVINKPAGLLSVPGKGDMPNAQDWLARQFSADDIRLVHRLDMATSGLLIAARSPRAHKRLQQQFILRRIEKRYVAVLSRPLPRRDYVVELPLRVDLDDRPRQMVCAQHGRPALTHVEVVASTRHTSRVHFHPKSGRTHQLRVHAAHHRGLNAPIVGDKLYGEAAQRLMLHANRLVFRHPDSGQMVSLQSKAPF